MRSPHLRLILIASAALPLTLAGCDSLWPQPAFKRSVISYDLAPAKATLVADPPKPIEVVAIPTPFPMPGQMKPAPTTASSVTEASDPKQRVRAANKAARLQPTRAAYLNAIQIYPFSEGALYQLYSAPGEITDIALEAGEQLVGSGPVAAGDTVRWIIGDTESGSGPTKRVHVLVKPTRPDLATNLVINTDRRTYHLDLRSDPRTYMASVSWSYPADQLIALRGRSSTANASRPVAVGVDVEAIKFRYRIEGDAPAWRPIRAFDDGRQVFITFPEGIAQGEMPPLWVIGPEGKGELVNYRVQGAHMVVDRLFAAAELRLGAKHQDVVRIVRTDGEAVNIRRGS